MDNNTVCGSCETEYTLIAEKVQTYCPFCGDSVLEVDEDLNYEELDFFEED
jgi:predicted RNA-binding Zn-ribbon protein involved in translation (DUF1610 family)